MPEPIDTKARRAVIARIRDAIANIDLTDRTADIGTLMAEAALSVIEDADDTMREYMTDVGWW